MKVCVLLTVFLSLGHTATAQPDFNTRLVVKLGEMLGVKPSKVQVELLSQKKMLGDYKEAMFTACMMGIAERFPYCSQIKVEGIFVQGIWVEEKDPEFVHIRMYQRAGVDVLIHEFCHWYLHHSTRPKGIANTHGVVEALATSLLISDEFIAWLEKEEKDD